MDHENKKTTFTDPRLAFAVEDQEGGEQGIRQRFDASSSALQVLHGRDLSGRVALVTGANSGIGRWTGTGGEWGRRLVGEMGSLKL